MIKNPFFIYIASFAAIFVAYGLGWSDAYPDLSDTLLTFLLLTFLIAFVIGLMCHPIIVNVAIHKPGLLPDRTIYVLIGFFCADLLANGLPPLISNAMGTFERGAFDVGIPHLHPAIVTFGCTFSIIRFADYLACSRARYLGDAAIPLVYLLLTLYRGPILVTLVSWAFVYLIERKLTLRKLGAMAALAMVGLFAFGILGQLREGSGAISAVGRPSQAFQALHLSEIVLWPYIYATSPVANLQLTLSGNSFNYTAPRDVSPQDMLLSEYLPDIISKRLMSSPRPATAEVSKGLNVATMFGRSAVFAGIPGMTAIFLWFCMVIVLYLRLLDGFALAVPALAILNTIVAFSTFQNMIAYSGMSLQLLWPILIVIANAYFRRPRMADL